MGVYMGVMCNLVKRPEKTVRTSRATRGTAVFAIYDGNNDVFNGLPY